MATIYWTAKLTVPAEMAWDFVERYTRSEVHAFSACIDERQVGEYRVVTTADGMEIWERNVTVDAERMRAVYTVPDFPGAEHHQAEMRIEQEPDGTATLVWSTDILPHRLADDFGAHFDQMIEDLARAISDHAATRAAG